MASADLGPSTVAGPRFVSTSRAQTPTGDQHRQRIFRRKSRRDNHETLNHSIKRGEGSAIVTHSSRHNCDSKCKHTRHLFGYFDRHRQLKEKLRRAACIKDKHERSVKLVKLQEELRGIDEANRKQRETDKAENRQARLHPEDLHSATDAWQVWRSRMLAWKDLRTADVREVDTIPFPVMFKAPYSPRLVSYREVARFWARMTPFCPLTPEEFVDVIQCARSTFLPSRFTGHQYVAAFGCEDDADARVIAYAATEVTSFISDMIDKIKDIPTMDHLYRRLIEFCLDE